VLVQVRSPNLSLLRVRFGMSGYGRICQVRLSSGKFRFVPNVRLKLGQVMS